MENKHPGLIDKIIPGAYLLLAFLYLAIVVRPAFYSHHSQPSFLLAMDYLAGYFEHPGGFSELLANLVMQSFYSWFLGPVVFMAVALAVAWLAFELMNTVHRTRLNRIWALVPLTLALVMADNYNLPFSVITAVLIVLLISLFTARKGNTPAAMLLVYTAGAASVYYLCGSGYLLLFSLIALLLSMKFRWWISLSLISFIVAFSIFVPWIAAARIFAIPPDQAYFYFFPPKLYFMTYEPTWIFYSWLVSVPLLLIMARIMAVRGAAGAIPAGAGAGAAGIVLIALAVFGHMTTYRADARNIVASDYHCHHGNTARAVRAATSVEEYSFSANLNHNLAIAKAGTLMENFFDFLQISGTDALYPDAEFSLEMSFIAADFYYDLGYISEARHWAHTALVYYPYSPRALRLLVKTHLVTGEYRAAERCLHMLDRGLTNRKFIREYSPYVNDTSLVRSRPEIMEKRRSIPAGKELSPLIEERLRELLEANEKNRRAHEYLMLYYLLDSQMERFLELYDGADRFFAMPVEIFEEAILMYGDRNGVDVEEKYEIRPTTKNRFEHFKATLQKYEGQRNMARNVLYWEMGQTYMYYLQFVFPRIIKPEIVYPEYEEAPI
ncbi:MAG TPA: hypothetical protein ENO05_03070 [Bacteroides sp.]|nr:hypothetical protein [Bacteroides sp.]